MDSLREVNRFHTFCHSDENFFFHFWRENSKKPSSSIPEIALPMEKTEQ